MREAKDLDTAPMLKLVTGGKTTDFNDPVWLRPLRKKTMFSCNVRNPNSSPENAVARIFVIVFNSGKTTVLQEVLNPGSPLIAWDTERFSSRFGLIEIIEEITGQEEIDDGDYSGSDKPGEMEPDDPIEPINQVDEGEQR